jgi:hypothetical protein
MYQDELAIGPATALMDTVITPVLIKLDILKVLSIYLSIYLSNYLSFSIDELESNVDRVKHWYEAWKIQHNNE